MPSSNSIAPVAYREIPRFLGYRFGEDGSIWSCRRMGKYPGLTDRWRQLRPCPSRTGHLLVGISSGGKRVNMLVHRLVLEAFVGPCPEGMECCHNDGNPANNTPSNLRWDTRQGNVNDTVAMDRLPRGSRSKLARLTEDDVATMIRLRQERVSVREIAARYALTESYASCIISGRHWKHVPRPAPSRPFHANSQLNREIVDEIRSLAFGGMKAHSIAQAVNIKANTVRDVIARRVWKDVPSPVSD